jgi:hypothetical protein
MIKASKLCEIEECRHGSTHTMNGIHVCDRCGTDFVSVGAGVVFFGGHWHGVRGAPNIITSKIQNHYYHISGLF